MMGGMMVMYASIPATLSVSPPAETAGAETGWVVAFPQLGVPPRPRAEQHRSLHRNQPYDLLGLNQREPIICRMATESTKSRHEAQVQTSRLLGLPVHL